MASGGSRLWTRSDRGAFSSQEQETDGVGGQQALDQIRSRRLQLSGAGNRWRRGAAGSGPDPIEAPSALRSRKPMASGGSRLWTRSDRVAFSSQEQETDGVGGQQALDQIRSSRLQLSGAGNRWRRG